VLEENLARLRGPKNRDSNLRTLAKKSRYKAEEVFWGGHGSTGKKENGSKFSSHELRGGKGRWNVRD